MYFNTTWNYALTVYIYYIYTVYIHNYESTHIVKKNIESIWRDPKGTLHFCGKVVWGYANSNCFTGQHSHFFYWWHSHSHFSQTWFQGTIFRKPLSTRKRKWVSWFSQENPMNISWSSWPIDHPSTVPPRNGHDRHGPAMRPELFFSRERLAEAKRNILWETKQAKPFSSGEM